MSNTNSMTETKNRLAQLAEKQAKIEAERKAIEEQLAAQRKESRASHLTHIVKNAQKQIEEFIGIPVGEWAKAPSDMKAEIADLIGDIVDALKADSPVKASIPTPRGMRLAGDEKKARDAAIAEDLRNGKTAAQVAEKFGLSEGMVNIIKRDAGLVLSRKPIEETAPTVSAGVVASGKGE